MLRTTYIDSLTLGHGADSFKVTMSSPQMILIHDNNNPKLRPWLIDLGPDVLLYGSRIRMEFRKWLRVADLDIDPLHAELIVDTLHTMMSTQHLAEKLTREGALIESTKA